MFKQATARSFLWAGDLAKRCEAAVESTRWREAYFWLAKPYCFVERHCRASGVVGSVEQPSCGRGQSGAR